MTYACLEDILVASAEAIRPAERMTVSESASRYHMTGGNGVAVRPFDLDKTPYLREPMDELESPHFTGWAFSGPARSGKSVCFINWLIHLAKNDPSNMMLVHMSRDTAREWSQQDLERAIANSPALADRLMPGRQNDNVFDKRFLSGMRLSVTWPTIKNLSGKTVGKLWIMDMDRIKPQLIDGEAHVFDATRARARTLRERGMCAAEASPGFDVTDPKWTPSSPHEAPPTQGILSIYNRGDRRRWYWECPHCSGKFEPQFKHLNWIREAPIAEAAASVWMECPHCYSTNGADILPGMMPELNRGGRWIKEGQVWLPSGDIVGDPRRSKIASFWMFGPAAGTVGPENWEHLVTEYLTAEETYEKTADEGPLRSTVNLNNGEPYLPKNLEGSRLPETLKSRAEDWSTTAEEPTVPTEAGGGFLVATVDVQARSFVVHVYLVSEGGVIWHVDMFKIRHSPDRTEVGPHGEPVPSIIDPAGHVTDWLTLIPNVIERTYPLNDGSGRRMAIKIVGCDSGGKDGVTSNAYDFYRHLRAEGMAGRFHLLKGAPSKTDTGVAMRPTLFDSQKKDKWSTARGDIPGWLINSNFVKDAVNNLMEAPDRIRYPWWAPDWLYAQLTNEIRDALKGWINVAGRRNEAFDLLVYCVALCTHPDIRLQFIDWTNPPSWAGAWSVNDFVFGADGQPAFSPKKVRLGLEELGNLLM